MKDRKWKVSDTLTVEAHVAKTQRKISDDFNSETLSYTILISTLQIHGTLYCKTIKLRQIRAKAFLNFTISILFSNPNKIYYSNIINQILNF